MEPQVLRGQVIHVNEDGWVVINRGAEHGVSDGLRFAVLGERTPRQIRDLFAAGEGAEKPASSVVLRADTAYELLRVILVERQCCVAISDRVPPERTPQPFVGPQGELLIYTPPPADWRYDALDLDEASEDAPDEANDAEEADDPAEDEAASEPAADASAEDDADLAGQQQERLWDGALPLNAVQVGDEVVMALPYRPGAWAAPAAAEASAPATADAPTTPSSYDWLKL
ncbi:MAG TPA: hypothetical protein VH590_03295 [Ktedonobacterales bacterium]|jgi:hypothetical protein